MKKYINKIIYIIFLKFKKIINTSSSKKINIITKIISNLIYYFPSLIKKIEYKNIKHALPHLNRKEIKKIQKNYYHHLTKLAIEISQTEKILNNWKKYIKIEEKSKPILKQIKKEKNTIIISCHYGNWEYLGLGLAKQLKNVNAIYRPLKNKDINNYIIKTRKKYPIKLINKNKAYKKSIEALNNKETLIILIDQNQAKNGIFIDFFGHQSASAKGAIILSYKTKTKIFISYIKRYQNKKHKITIKKIKLKTAKSLKEYIHSNTQNLNKEIENIIRAYPPQWLWSHRRWKTKPKKSKINKISLT